MLYCLYIYFMYTVVQCQMYGDDVRLVFAHTILIDYSCIQLYLEDSVRLFMMPLKRFE